MSRYTEKILTKSQAHNRKLATNHNKKSIKHKIKKIRKDDVMEMIVIIKRPPT